MRKTSRNNAIIRRLAWCLAISVASWHCGNGSPVAPDQVSPASADSAGVAVISGQIYTSVGPKYPVISGAVVEVNEADGSSVIVESDAAGLYRIPVRRGAVTATVSKAGYQPKQWQFDLTSDTVLNFGLDPQ